MIIKFKNWDTYNPKSQKTVSWFRVNSNLISRPIWEELDNDAFRVFIYLLCQANESENRGVVHVSTVGVSRRCTVGEKVVHRTIKILKQFQIIEVRAPSGLFIDAGKTLSTYVRTYDTNDTKREILPDSPLAEPRRVFDFDSLYKNYPRKEGKAKGLAICKAQIKTETDFNELDLAIQRYADHVKKTASDTKYVKYFSSFMASWRDWLDPETGTANTQTLEERYAFLED